MDLLHLAARAARRAGEYLQVAGGPSDWIAKGHHDWVTEVDRTAEGLIAEVLLGGTPGSRIVGEELSPDPVGQGLVWIVDPLDGTTNFLHGYPQYAVSIAAARDGVLEAGVVLDVCRELLYGAVRGQGAWLGGHRLRVADTTLPSRALLGTGYPFKQLDQFDRYLDQFRRVLPATSGVRRAGAAALDLADVAAGRLDGFWELSLAPWDFAAGALLIREAGGIITGLDGDDLPLAPSGVIAGNAALHAWLLSQLRES